MKEQSVSFPSAHILKFVPSALKALLCAVLAVLCSAFVVKAQDTGYISGTVTDKSGAAVAGADVTVSSGNGSFSRSTTTNGDGVFAVAGLPGGTYDVTVTAKGFQKYTAQKVVLNVGDKANVAIQLTVGAITEEVVVTGESVAQVETQSSELSATITGKQIDNLVLNGRNFTQLVNITPGVVNQTGQDEGTVGVYGNVAYSMNGGRNEYNNWELDGGDNMDNGSNATLNVYPNPEAIAEFKVLTSNYGAQYGRNASGTVEVETKSGGSSFHGSAFEYLRNDFFNARPWTSGGEPGTPNPPYKKHDFGYTIGGPVYIPNHYNADKKKTFFFFSQEWRRQKDPYSILQNVPSAAERGGNFSDLCPGPDCPHQANGSAFPGNTVTPTAVGTALLALIPAPNTTNAGFPAVAQDISLPTTWREELIRIDHNISDKYRLTFRYIHDSWQTQTPNPLWGQGASFDSINSNFVGPGSSFVARMNANFSPTLLNEFVASYTADHIFLTTINNPPLPSGFAMGSLINNGFDGKLPTIVLGNNTAYGGGFTGDSGYFPWNNANPTYTYRDNVTKVLRTHTFQFGAYFAAAQKNEDNSPYNQGILTFSSTNSTVSTGNAFTDLLLGDISSYSQNNFTIKYYNRYKIVEPYFQDDWRMTKRLTLNLGLRVSMFGTYRERYQHAFAFDPKAFNPANVPGFNADGSLNTGSGSGNPLNGVVQCGGKGGQLPFVPGSAFPTVNIGASPNAGCLQGHLFNPAPRIGFAFDPKGDGKMAIRGGYGVFFEHTNGNEANTESLEGTAPLAINATQSNIIGYQNIGASSGPVPIFPLASASVTNIPLKVTWPYAQQWNLGVEKELPGHFVASVAYVGSKGTHLTLQSDFNQLHPTPASQNPFLAGKLTLAGTGVVDPVTGPEGACAGPLGNANVQPWGAGQTVPGTSMPLTAQAAINLNVACGTGPQPFRPFLGYANVTSLQDAANSIYHALQAQVQRTVGDLTLSVAYTYSHSIDDSSDRGDAAFVNSYDFASNRASSSFDQRHAASISYVYAFPFFKEKGLMHTLLGGWQASGITIAQTGLPFTVTNGIVGDNAGVANGTGTGSRPDLVGNPQAVTAAQQAASQAAGTRGLLFYNPAAYADPVGLTFGDVGRDTLYLPGRLNFDFGLFKRFQFGESRELDFRWENFNLFNHTQFDQVSGSTSSSSNTSSTFLVMNQTHAPRRMQFGLRLQF
ncbi:MAG TPA: carboxypeptidase regulatory-like domain-containing protein [Candidatus Methylomirabilis sp.]|nr:carboxypeptidase regulatory-like domain-containing protein [Candidatus Methylomirabilis sp.]